MAEAILYSIAERILGRLGSAGIEEIGLLWRVNDELQELEKTVSAIKAVLLDAEKQRFHNHQVRNWLERLEEVVYEADDLVDDFSTEALRRRLMRGNDISKQVRTFFSSSNQLGFRSKVGHKIKQVRKKLADIAADRIHLNLEERYEVSSHVVTRMRDHTHSFVHDEEVIGRGDDRMAILQLLLDAKTEENVSVIPIVGAGGLGKTTAAQLVFNDKNVQQHFEVRLWVCVSDVFDLRLLVEKITKFVIADNVNFEMEQLQKHLREKLNGKRYLLVLDDVWNESRERWLGLTNLLPNDVKGSKIIVTTRSEIVARIVGTMQPYHLKVLDEENSWNLFKQMAFEKEQESKIDSNTVEIGKQIVKKCGGIPLAIRTIGSMLYGKNPETEWLLFNEKELLEISKMEDILPTLKLSYDHLPSHLKHCFAYCRLFPKDYAMDVQTLINLWVAQDFVKASEPNQCLEDVGYDCFKELLWRSFFQVVKKDEWGNVATCKMHDLMHDLAIFVAGTKCAMLNGNDRNINKKTRHVSFDCNSNSHMFGEMLPSLIEAKKIRSAIIVCNDNFTHRGVIIGTFRTAQYSLCDAIGSNLKLLRTLNLQNLNMREVPKSIGKLKHLRYLDLSENWFEALPNSITKLHNLQTLKLSSCKQLGMLPKNIDKLVNLRNLDINSCTGLKCMPHGLGQLTSLRILSKFVLCLDIDYGHNGGKLDELETLNNLRGHLTIENLRHGEDAIQQSKAAQLKEKQHLQSLELSWYGIVDVHSIEAEHHEMQLEGLQPHPNLNSLSLNSYNGIKFPSWVMSLTNLVRFVLVSCSKCQHLSPLHLLPSLKQLRLERLHSLEFISKNNAGGDISCSSSTPTPLFFPSLEDLMLNDLPNLKGWWKDGDSFDILPTFPYSLSIITVWKCPKLTCMPLFPYVSKSINLQNSSWKPFQQTILSGAEPLPTSATNIIEPSSSSPAEAATSLSSFSSLSHLTTLIGSWIPFQQTILSGATRLPTSATTTEASWPLTLSSSFTPLSQLTTLIIINIEDLQFLPVYLKSLTSLKTLQISHCEELKSLSPGIQNLTSLQDLEIESCEELNMFDGDDGNTMWEPLQSLRFLKLKGLPKLVDLPEGLQHLTSLQLLEIDRCSNLVSLPRWIKSFKSLKGLQISQCPKMASLPEEIKSLSSLQTLRILGCSILGPRCLRDTGEDWPKVAHIPKLKVAECIY